MILKLRSQSLIHWVAKLTGKPESGVQSCLKKLICPFSGDRLLGRNNRDGVVVIGIAAPSKANGIPMIQLVLALPTAALELLRLDFNHPTVRHFLGLLPDSQHHFVVPRAALDGNRSNGTSFSGERRNRLTLKRNLRKRR